MQQDRTNFSDIDLKLILEDEANVRRVLAGIDDLAREVRRDGVLQPILVRRHPTEDGKFQIIAGHRRVAAARQAGLERVPARDVADDDKTALQLIENIQREDLSAVEVAHALKALMENAGGTAADVAERVGQSQNWVNRHLALLRLDPKVITAILRGRLRGCERILRRGDNDHRSVRKTLLSEKRPDAPALLPSSDAMRELLRRHKPGSGAHVRERS